MIYKISTGVLLLGVIFLGTRLNVAEKKAETNNKASDKVFEENLVLQEKLDGIKKEYDLLLDAHGKSLQEINELEFQLEQNPKIVYKYAKKNNINRRASEQFNELLTKRYVIE